MVGYLDPFNERANDSFFDQLPKLYGKTKEDMTYESFYGSPTGKNKKKKNFNSSSHNRRSESADLGNDFTEQGKNTSNRSDFTADTERSSSPEIPPENSRIGYDRSTLFRTPLSGWKSRNVIDDSVSGASHKGRTSSAGISKRDSPSSLSRGMKKEIQTNNPMYLEAHDNDEAMEYEGDLQDSYVLPPALQVKPKSKRDSTRTSRKNRGESNLSGRVSSTVQDVRGSKSKEASDHARSDERKNEDSLNRTISRERSLSLGRLRKKKEDIQIQKQDHQLEQHESLSTSLPSMGYQELREERSRDCQSRHRKRDSDEEGGRKSLRSSPSNQRRSSSVGRMSNKVKQNRKEKQSSRRGKGHGESYHEKKRSDGTRNRDESISNSEGEESLSSCQQAIVYRDDRNKSTDREFAERSSSKRQSEHGRSNSLGRVNQKTAEHRVPSPPPTDRKVKRCNSLGPFQRQMLDRREDPAAPRTENPKRSNSVVPLKKKKEDQKSDRQEGRTDSITERPGRSNGFGPLHKNKEDTDRRSARHASRMERSKRSNSVGPLRKKLDEIPVDGTSSNISRHSENKPRKKPSRDDDLSLAPSMYQQSRGPKPASSSMDEIFGSAEELKQAKREKLLSATAINAVHGNKAALAAWKLRESFRISPRKQVQSKISVSTTSEIATTIEQSPHATRGTGQFQGVPSLFLSPKSCRKDKLPTRSNKFAARYEQNCTSVTERQLGVGGGGNRRPKGSLDKSEVESLPPAFHHLSPRSERVAARGNRTGKGEHKKLRDDNASERRSLKDRISKIEK
jgi:hypothetical protein